MKIHKTNPEKMSTFSSSKARLEAAVNAIQWYNAIEGLLTKRTEEEAEALRAMDGARERIRTLGIEGDCAAADALIDEVDKRYVDAMLETMEQFQAFVEAQREMKAVFVAAGMRGSEAFAHYYGSVIDSTPETKAMVARMVAEEEEADNTVTDEEEEEAEDDERPAKRCCSQQRFDVDSSD